MGNVGPLGAFRPLGALALDVAQSASEVQRLVVEMTAA